MAEPEYSYPRDVVQSKADDLAALEVARRIAREQRDPNGEVCVAGPESPEPVGVVEALYVQEIERLHAALLTGVELRARRGGRPTHYWLPLAPDTQVRVPVEAISSRRRAYRTIRTHARWMPRREARTRAADAFAWYVAVIEAP